MGLRIDLPQAQLLGIPGAQTQILTGRQEGSMAPVTEPYQLVRGTVYVVNTERVEEIFTVAAGVTAPQRFTLTWPHQGQLFLGPTTGDLPADFGITIFQEEQISINFTGTTNNEFTASVIYNPQLGVILPPLTGVDRPSDGQEVLIKSVGGDNVDVQATTIQGDANTRVDITNNQPIRFTYISEDFGYLIS